MDEPAVKMGEKQIRFLKDLLDTAIPYMVEVEVKKSTTGTYWIQFATIAEGIRTLEKFLSNSPFYVEALLREVNRLRNAIKKVNDMATQSGPAEKLLNDIDKFAKEVIAEEESKLQAINEQMDSAKDGVK